MSVHVGPSRESPEVQFRLHFTVPGYLHKYGKLLTFTASGWITHGGQRGSKMMAEDVTKASLQAELYNHQACKSESVACKNVKPSICTFLKKKKTHLGCVLLPTTKRVSLLQWITPFNLLNFFLINSFFFMLSAWSLYQLASIST